MASKPNFRSLYWASDDGKEEEVERLLRFDWFRENINVQIGTLGGPLHAASVQGHLEVVKLLLKGGAHINAPGGHLGTALQIASYRGDKEMVELLLDRKANVNARGGRYGSALQAASCARSSYENKLIGDNLSVVHLLLDRGANVNAKGGKYGNALQAASHTGSSHGGNLSVIRLLLDRGADINAQGGQYGNALQAASCTDSSYGDSLSVIRLLLDQGADVNAKGGTYGNALQAASHTASMYGGDLSVIQLLLDKGADINAQGGYYGNALQAASYADILYTDNLSVVQLLLDRGAEVNAHGGEYGNALQAASNRGNLSVTRLLLDRGADINAQGGCYGNALQAALSRFDRGTIKLLLESGAETNPKNRIDLRQTALSRGDKDIVKLLDKRAKGNTQEVQAVSSTKHRAKRVRLQLAEELDVNAQSGQHDTALQTASDRIQKRGAVQVAAESGLFFGETTHVPVSKAIEDDSSVLGTKIMNFGDEDLEINELSEPWDDSSGSEYEIMSDVDEDFASADSRLLENISPFASLIDRISNPVEYFDGLGNLAHSIYRHSTLRLYRTPWTITEEKKYLEPCPEYPQLKKLTPDDFDPISDSDVLRICRDVAVTHHVFANDLLEILECRNVNAHTYSNLRRMQVDRFCLQKFSMLAIDPYRNDVARLLPIDIQQISQLLKETESVLRKIVDLARCASPITSLAKVFPGQPLEESDNLLLSVPCCMEFLATLGFVLASPSDNSINLPILAVLRLVVHTADLAVASYAGAHLDRFDEVYLGEEIHAVDVLSPFTSLHHLQVPSIKLSRCQLQCLDSFHDSQSVWVFSSSHWEPRGHLFLSTKVEDFADIWGPLWKVFDAENHNSCIRYAVGNGCIYKWKSLKAAPPLLENETLCHWIPNSTIEAGSIYSTNTEKPVFPDMIDEAFDGSETLLIGAVAAGCERLATKMDCNFDLDRRRSALNDDGRVQMLGTVKEHTYKDSETYQLQAGHGGITVGASKQYKRRGQSLKNALVELWVTTPEARDPRILQDFYGLEVSLCTQNAQRIQLGRILGLGSMCRYLNSFTWKTECAKRAYFDALRGFREDSDALQHSWERHNQYREDFGRAVLVCLKALEKTGINHKGQLGTFLSSTVTARPEVVAMEPKEHSWIGLLKDTESSCCMAVIGDECLEFRHEHGAMCGRSGSSVLRTALVINRMNTPRGICKKRAYSYEATDGWTSRWSVKAMDTNSDIWLGKHGTLRLLSQMPEGTLLMDWRASIISTAFKSFIVKEKPHREYSENIQKEARRTRPIPLFVMSSQ